MSPRLRVLLPWGRGACSRRAGAPIEANPYFNASPAWVAWRSGWRHEDEHPGNELPADPACAERKPRTGSSTAGGDAAPSAACHSGGAAYEK